MRILAGHPRLELVLRVLLGAFFVYASLDKIWNPAAFAKIVYQWQVVGPVPSNLVAVTLPWVELLAGVLLLAGVWRRESALVTGAHARHLAGYNLALFGQEIAQMRVPVVDLGDVPVTEIACSLAANG